MAEIEHLSNFKLFTNNPYTNPFNKPVSSYVSLKKTQKKTLVFTSSNKPFNLITFITPISKYKWVGGNGMAMAFLSVKSTARNQFNPIIAKLASNPTFVSGLLALCIAQTMRVVLNFVVERKWELRLLCSSGGMPSSHSALCSALTSSVGFCHGFGDSLFPVCLGFSLIVMYDAIGIRRHAGIQAQVLNKIIEDLFQGHPMSERKLKELLGHTPSQVIAGALLGFLVACYCCQGCVVPI